MDRFLFEMKTDAKQISPLTLAFVGDAVYDLLVREKIVCDANRSVNDLHSIAVKQVKASAQAKTAEMLFDYFTEEEMSFFKRGRNAKTAHIAKNASTCDYHKATGLETVFGYLYLSGNIERIKELFEIIRRLNSDES